MKNQNVERFPWPQFFSELVVAAMMALVGLSLVTIIFWVRQPRATDPAERGVVEADYRFSLRHDRRADCDLSGWQSKRGAHRHQALQQDSTDLTTITDISALDFAPSLSTVAPLLIKVLLITAD